MSRLYYGEESNPLTDEIVNVCAGMEFNPRFPIWKSWAKESQSCSIAGMLLVGRLAEQAAGKLLYYDYAKQSPVMLDMFRFCKSVNLIGPTSL